MQYGVTEAAWPTSPVVLALVVERVARTRIVDALRGRASIQFCNAVRELLEHAQRGPASAVVIGPRDDTGTSTIACVSALREAAPTRPVVAYFDLAIHSSREVLELARAGVNELVIHGQSDTPAILRATLEAAHQDSARDCVLRRLHDDIPHDVRVIVEYCIANARNDLTIDDVAAALRVHRRTLSNRLARAGYPPTRVIVAWTCLLVASVLLQSSSCTVESIALDLEYPSATAFRNTLKRYTGLRPGEVRENGGLSCLLHLFAREVIERRPAGIEIRSVVPAA